MTLGRIVVALLAALALAGCGGESTVSETGVARLVVTRDRGAEVLLDEQIAPGQTLARALNEVADVETSYGGQYVEAIEGIEGDAAAQRDWFWFVNGVLGDRSAAAYRLRAGDVAWWDYRNWSDDAETLRVAVGAFPEPFLHGYDGKKRLAVVRYAPGQEAQARRVATMIGALDVAPVGTAAPAEANVFELTTGRERFVADVRDGSASASAPVRFVFSGDVDRVLDGAYAWRLSVP